MSVQVYCPLGQTEGGRKISFGGGKGRGEVWDDPQEYLICCKRLKRFSCREIWNYSTSILLFIASSYKYLQQGIEFYDTF